MYLFTQRRLFIIVLAIVAIGAAACAPAAAPTATAPTNPPAPTSMPATSAPAPTTVPAATTVPSTESDTGYGAEPTESRPTPTGAPASAAAQAVTLQLVDNDQLGKFLADGNGMTLYLFTKDVPGTSNCYDKCATAWPPVIPDGAPTLEEGVAANLISTTLRTDGSTQLTYNGWPLYYYFEDTQPGEVLGQAANNVWWVVSGEGNPIKPAALGITTTEKLGQILVDGEGRTLYMFTKDSPDTSTCYDKCEVAWPPLLQIDQPTAGEGVDSSLLGTTTRKDGTTQVTYNGLPLYYYLQDQAAGDVNGQGVGDVWYVVSPDGKMVE